MAIAISLAVLISGVVSLTLTPLLCSRFLRPPGAIRHRPLYALSERYFVRMLQAYEWSLKKTLDHGPTTLILSGFILVATIYLFIIVPKGFLPRGDTNQIMGFTQASQGISLESMQKHQKKIAAIISENPSPPPFGKGRDNTPLWKRGGEIFWMMSF